MNKEEKDQQLWRLYRERFGSSRSTACAYKRTCSSLFDSLCVCILLLHVPFIGGITDCALTCSYYPVCIIMKRREKSSDCREQSSICHRFHLSAIQEAKASSTRLKKKRKGERIVIVFTTIVQSYTSVYESQSTSTLRWLMKRRREWKKSTAQGWQSEKEKGKESGEVVEWTAQKTTSWGRFNQRWTVESKAERCLPQSSWWWAFRSMPNNDDEKIKRQYVKRVFREITQTAIVEEHQFDKKRSRKIEDDI